MLFFYIGHRPPIFPKRPLIQRSMLRSLDLLDLVPLESATRKRDRQRRMQHDVGDTRLGTPKLIAWIHSHGNTTRVSDVRNHKRDADEANFRNERITTNQTYRDGREGNQGAIGVGEIEETHICRGFEWYLMESRGRQRAPVLVQRCHPASSFEAPRGLAKKPSWDSCVLVITIEVQ